MGSVGLCRGLVAAEYLLIVVGVVQAFMKVPPVRASAPTQSEPPFALVQGTVLVAFVLIGIQALRVSRLRGTRPSFR